MILDFEEGSFFKVFGDCQYNPDGTVNILAQIGEDIVIIKDIFQRPSLSTEYAIDKIIHVSQQEVNSIFFE